ncbi:hypothetical protein [Dankookia sp. P2]
MLRRWPWPPFPWALPRERGSVPTCLAATLADAGRQARIAGGRERPEA